MQTRFIIKNPEGTCLMYQCEKPGTELTVETSDFSMLFPKGFNAAWLCDEHATKCEQVGGYRVKPEEREECAHLFTQT